MDQKADQLRMVQGALEEKRTELLKTETQLREMEEKYYSSSVTVQDQVVQDLRVSNIVNWMDFTCWHLRNKNSSPSRLISCKIKSQNIRNNLFICRATDKRHICSMSKQSVNDRIILFHVLNC